MSVPKSSRGASPGRVTQKPPGRDSSARGSSVQGELRPARGAPQGANQGGAPRGGSRVEPSHAQDIIKKDRAGAAKKSRGRAGRGS